MTSPSTDAGELLPCPFCGSPKVDPKGWGTLPEYAATPDEQFGPACDSCGASAQTVEIWNTRAATAPAQAGEVVAWQWRVCINGQWGAWLNLDQPIDVFCGGRWKHNLENGTAELRPLYAAPVPAILPSAGLIEAARRVVERWDAPNWKLRESTAALINSLRDALGSARSDDDAVREAISAIQLIQANAKTMAASNNADRGIWQCCADEAHRALSALSQLRPDQPATEEKLNG